MDKLSSCADSQASVHNIAGLLVHPAAIATPDVRGSDAIFVVEVAETSLAYDLKTKVLPRARAPE
jgi:hypothetical protein